MLAERGDSFQAVFVDGAVMLRLAEGVSDVFAVTSLEVEAALGFTTGLK